MDNSESIDFKYKFRFENGSQKEFLIQIDSLTLQLIRSKKDKLPNWTRLEFYQCSNCPLQPDKIRNCPLAESIVDIIDFFAESLSYEKVEVTLETAERTYIKNTNIQSSVSSLLGIYSVSCGCPILAKLRPMVRYHLPFATIEETMYRAISMYLMKQFFNKRKGIMPDWNLDGLKEIYYQIHITNTDFHTRLSQLKTKDANVNALIILDTFASYINLLIDKDRLTLIERLFENEFE